MITVNIDGESIDLLKVVRYRDPKNVNEATIIKKRERSNRWYAELKKDPVRHREHLNRMAARRNQKTRKNN